MNEVAALMLVLNCTTVKELLLASIHGFDEKKDVRSQDLSNLCIQAIEAYLKQLRVAFYSYYRQHSIITRFIIPTLDKEFFNSNLCDTLSSFHPKKRGKKDMTILIQTNPHKVIQYLAKNQYIFTVRKVPAGWLFKINQ